MNTNDEAQLVGSPESGCRKPNDGLPTNWATERGRFNSTRKVEAVLRLLRGEELDVLSRELGVAASTLAGWKDAFLLAGQTGLKSRQPDVRDEENARLKTLVGDLTLRLEIHRQAEKLRAGEFPFAPGKRK